MDAPLNLGTDPNDWVRECTLDYLINEQNRISLGIKAIPDLVSVEISAGVGRNAVWLAGHDFNATVFHSDKDNLIRSTLLAKKAGVHVNTRLGNFQKASRPEDAWAGLADFVVASFYPVPRELRETFFQALRNITAPGGLVIGEWFHPDQVLGHGSTGFRIEPSLLINPKDLRSACADWTIFVCQRVERNVDEGDFRMKRALVTQLAAQKPFT